MNKVYLFMNFYYEIIALELENYMLTHSLCFLILIANHHRYLKILISKFFN